LPGGRQKSREIVFRILYETEITGDDSLEALEFALGRYRLTPDGRDHALRLCRLYGLHAPEIDRRIREHLQNWDLGRLSGVVRAILRLATAELMGAADVPGRVILDQAVELGKKYGEEGAEGFVNGVLDPILAQERPQEVSSGEEGSG
jgi:transcription antitermination protein NusB